MCLGDWQLAKLMKSATRFVAVAASDTLIVPASPHRVGLIFTPPGGSNVRLLFDYAGTASRGVYLEPSSDPFMLTLVDNGDLVTREWRGICASGSTTMVVFETFYNPADHNNG